ncbi:MAG: hypothetical protein ACUVTX_08250 [Bacteroidales bacterium]
MVRFNNIISFYLLFMPAFLFINSCSKFGSSAFGEARNNGVLANEGFNRCISYVNAWSHQVDPETGLIPRNIKESKDIWNAWDAAADNYPFMVLTSSILMPDFFSSTAVKMLETERKLTSRIGSLPDTYSFSKKGFRNEVIDTSQIIFGSAEYMKDGLIPLTEWLGKSIWSDRMLELLDDLRELVMVVKELNGKSFGRNAVVEVNGDLLQVLSRMFWFTGSREYLEWAADIADYYLNDQNLITHHSDHLRLRDHGCEIISGLCETYLAAYYAWPEKREQWKKFIHMMLDRILETGRNNDGLFYNEINPVTGEIISRGIADTFGYTFNAYYFIGMIDTIPYYREAVIKALDILYEKYRSFNWENGGCDGYADAIEGALNLYNREPLPSLKKWLDSEIKIMWNYQKPDGMIEGWHGDGNFARTTIMYCLWKTQGILPDNWNEKLNLGAIYDSGELKIAVSCENGWTGRIKFNLPGYKEKMHMPIDYPRINQFQQWFVPEPDNLYKFYFNHGATKTFTGSNLIKGIPLSIKPGEELLIKCKIK